MQSQNLNIMEEENELEAIEKENGVLLVVGVLVSMGLLLCLFVVSLFDLAQENKTGSYAAGDSEASAERLVTLNSSGIGRDRRKVALKL